MLEVELLEDEEVDVVELDEELELAVDVVDEVPTIVVEDEVVLDDEVDVFEVVEVFDVVEELKVEDVVDVLVAELLLWVVELVVVLEDVVVELGGGDPPVLVR